MTDLKRDEELADARWVMSAPQGRRFIRRLLKFTRYGGTVLEWNELPKSIPPEYAIWVAGGIREVGGFLHDEIATASPQGVQLMNREAYAELIAKGNEVPKVPAKEDAE